MIPSHLSVFDATNGTVSGHSPTRRLLSDIRGYFVDVEAYENALALGDVLLYTVTPIETQTTAGALWYATGCIYPGKIGQEYFMTKGHFHAWRPASEVYVGLRGTGLMLLEDEKSGESQALPLTPDSAVYVPGHTAHRTINVGDVPLTYVGIFPCKAGHDYGAIAERNFHHIVVEAGGAPTVIPRAEY